MLPPLVEGESITLKGIQCEQHFTEPPPRYTEASLVKALEEYGIGRPSTYATIISTLQQREYVEMDRKRFKPTDVGRVVSKFLTEHFTQYVDYGFTALMEDELDAVVPWREGMDPGDARVLGPVQEAGGPQGRERLAQGRDHREAMDEACPKCGKPLSIRLGRRGRFIGCTGYPDCDYTRNLDETAEQAAQPQKIEGRQCPQVQLGPHHPPRPLWQVHRLLRLPELQTHRTAGETRGHGRASAPSASRPLS